MKRNSYSSQPAVPTLEDLLWRFDPKSIEHNANAAKPVRVFHEFFREIIRLPVSSLTFDQLYDLRRAKQQRCVSPLTINTHYSKLRRLLALAVEDDIIPVNPIRRLHPLPTPLPRNRVFTPDERDRLWRALSTLETNLKARAYSSSEESYASPLTPKFLFAAMTGLTLGTCNKLSWADCDLKIRTIITQTSKRGRRLLPMGDGVCDLLRRWQEQCPGPLVFPNSTPSTRRASIRTSWNYVASVGVEDLRWNDLRTDFAGHLITLGASHEQVHYLMGCPTDEQIIDDALLAELRATLALRETYCPYTLPKLGQFCGRSDSPE